MFFGKQKFDVKQLKLNKFIFDVKQFRINKFTFEVKQLKMNRFIKSLSDLIISTSNARLRHPRCAPALSMYDRSSHLQMFFKIGVLKNFVNFTGKQCVGVNFVKKRLKCFSVTFAKF